MASTKLYKAINAWILHFLVIFCVCKNVLSQQPYTDNSNVPPLGNTGFPPYSGGQQGSNPPVSVGGPQGQQLVGSPGNQPMPMIPGSMLPQQVPNGLNPMANPLVQNVVQNAQQLVNSYSQQDVQGFGAALQALQLSMIQMAIQNNLAVGGIYPSSPFMGGSPFGMGLHQMSPMSTQNDSPQNILSGGQPEQDNQGQNIK